MSTKIICSEMPRVAKCDWKYSTSIEVVAQELFGFREWLYGQARQNGVPEGIKHTIISGKEPHDLDTFVFEWWEVIL